MQSQFDEIVRRCNELAGTDRLEEWTAAAKEMAAHPLFAEHLASQKPVEELVAEIRAEKDTQRVGQIVEQRAKGWPDFHPEDFCHRCGRPNARSWFVDSALWNVAVENTDRGVLNILCPPCFVELFEAAGGGDVAWELRPDPATIHHLRADLRPASHLVGEETRDGTS